ncbi:MAG: hypothetical protein M3041_01265 [Acidobacteriota bacterium]|nr:hypothetical protein [Acidobacteriota bacterium]
MARQGKTGNRIARAGSAIKRTAKKVTARLRPAKRRQEPKAAAAAPRRAKGPRASQAAARPTQRRTDIPLEVLNRTYTPKQTSLKASFRASGQEQGKDQELAGGFSDERFNDEDRLTNKSGDPRIGTHHRKYEPGE